MPRSRRRKGVKHAQTIREQTPAAKRRQVHRSYYDPAKSPRPRNHAKANKAKR